MEGVVNTGSERGQGPNWEEFAGRTGPGREGGCGLSGWSTVLSNGQDKALNDQWQDAKGHPGEVPAPYQVGRDVALLSM